MASPVCQGTMPGKTPGKRPGPCAHACLWAALLVCCLFLGACQGKTGQTQSPSPLIEPDNVAKESGQGRVSPVHEQWLYRQSMLGASKELLEKVPAALLWRNASAKRDRHPVLASAPTWAVVPGKPRFASVSQTLPLLASLGVQGLWLRHAREGDLAWLQMDAQQRDEDASGLGDTGTASLAADPALGGADELRALLAGLASQNMQGGMPLVPAATGLGPDFMLQARMSERYTGLYTLFEIPRSHWDLLPRTRGPWDTQELANKTVASLDKYLPAHLVQDNVPAQSRAGYAVTGEILGLDGQTRRYAYRYYGTRLDPVLDWQNPSGEARKILMASGIQTTGIFRQTLAGIDVSALAGLDTEATNSSTASGAGVADLEPALSALGELSRTVHRCGGWSLCLDPVSPDMAREALKVADFVEAPGFAKALALALQGGDAKGLRDLLEEYKKLDTRALAFPALKQEDDASKPERPDQGDARPKDRTDAGPGTKSGKIPESRAELEAREDHLLLALPCGLPGLALLDARLLLRPGGEAPSKAALHLTQALEARSRLDLGTGRLVKTIVPSQSTLATIVALPAGGYMITVLNLSRKPAQVVIATGLGADAVTSLTPGVQVDQASSPTSFALSLKARQAAHLVAGTGLSAKAKD